MKRKAAQLFTTVCIALIRIESFHVIIPSSAVQNERNYIVRKRIKQRKPLHREERILDPIPHDIYHLDLDKDSKDHNKLERRKVNSVHRDDDGDHSQESIEHHSFLGEHPIEFMKVKRSQDKSKKKSDGQSKGKSKKKSNKTKQPKSSKKSDGGKGKSKKNQGKESKKSKSDKSDGGKGKGSKKNPGEVTKQPKKSKKSKGKNSKKDKGSKGKCYTYKGKSKKKNVPCSGTLDPTSSPTRQPNSSPSIVITESPTISQSPSGCDDLDCPRPPPPTRGPSPPSPTILTREPQPNETPAPQTKAPIVSPAPSACDELDCGRPTNPLNTLENALNITDDDLGDTADTG